MLGSGISSKNSNTRPFKVFGKTHDEATKIMLQIHTEGIGICGVYPLEIAETKMNQVLNLSKESQHPLQCIIEKI